MRRILLILFVLHLGGCVSTAPLPCLTNPDGALCMVQRMDAEQEAREMDPNMPVYIMAGSLLIKLIYEIMKAKGAK